MLSLPEMMFGDVLRIQHCSGFGIEFNATDALRCVNNYQGTLKVGCAEEWRKAGQRANTPKKLLSHTVGPTQQIMRERYLESHSSEGLCLQHII